MVNDKKCKSGKIRDPVTDKCITRYSKRYIKEATLGLIPTQKVKICAGKTISKADIAIVHKAIAKYGCTCPTLKSGLKVENPITGRCVSVTASMYVKLVKDHIIKPLPKSRIIDIMRLHYKQISSARANKRRLQIAGLAKQNHEKIVKSAKLIAAGQPNKAIAELEKVLETKAKLLREVKTELSNIPVADIKDIKELTKIVAEQTKSLEKTETVVAEITSSVQPGVLGSLVQAVTGGPSDRDIEKMVTALVETSGKDVAQTTVNAITSAPMEKEVTDYFKKTLDITAAEADEKLHKVLAGDGKVWPTFNADEKLHGDGKVWPAYKTDEKLHNYLADPSTWSHDSQIFTGPTIN